MRSTQKNEPLSVSHPAGISRGRLFVLEGPDGVGKTTLAHLLVEQLNSADIRCDYYAFPGKQTGSLGHLVDLLHHDPSQICVDGLLPASLQVLHIAAHIDSMFRYIRPALDAGRNVVLDRFWWSTWVYGVVSRVDRRSLELMLQLELHHWGELIPACVFLITRHAPLDQKELSSQWYSVHREYENLARMQQECYPVHVIINEHTLTESLDEMLSWTVGLGAYSVSSGSSGHPCSCPLRALPLDLGLQSQLSLDLHGNQALSGVVCEAPEVLSRLSPAKPTEVYDTYWRFAAERQNVFFRRVDGSAPPWTADPIVRRYKFTNAYRASDRVSQYLVRRVIYEGDQSPVEVFFRVLLFKIFNRIDTWQLLESELGTITFSEYSFDRYDAILGSAIGSGKRIFSAAYVMPSGVSTFGDGRKHRSYLRLLECMIGDDVPTRLAETHRMRDAFELLRSYPMIGDFLAYQYVTDLNYSELTDYSEMEFVVPGPGARSGIRKCFSSLGGLGEIDIIQWVVDHQEEEFERLGLSFQSLWGRPLQLIDCQNLFCEVDKYARLAHPDAVGLGDRKRIKQSFTQTPSRVDYWYPPKWGLNQLIARGTR